MLRTARFMLRTDQFFLSHFQWRRFSNQAEVAERLDNEGLPVWPHLVRLVPGRRRAVQFSVGQAAALLGAGDVYVLDVDAVCVLYPADDIPVSGLAGDHALMVAVVVQGCQDAG